jgi:hypothetical protein
MVTPAIIIVVYQKNGLSEQILVVGSDVRVDLR